jgi:hypothetical protein
MRIFGLDHHHRDNPMDGASPVEIEFYHMLAHIINQMERLMSAMDDLATSVTAEDTVIDSAVALINGFAAQLAAAGTDPTKLASLKADIDAKKATLAAAVLANTPTPAPAATPVTPAVATTAATAAVAGS